MYSRLRLCLFGATLTLLPALVLAQTYDPVWTSHNGEITSTDPDNAARAGTKWDLFSLNGVSAGETVHLYMRAGTLSDPYLQVTDSSGNVIAEDDDSGSGASDGSYFPEMGWDAYVGFTYQPGYQIRATTFSEFTDSGSGTYRLYMSAGSVVDIGSDDGPAIPTIASVTSSSLGGTSKAGDTISIQADFSEPVTVTATPRIALSLGAETRYATYSSGSGGASLIFVYTVQPGDAAPSGITLTSPIDLDGGSIVDDEDDAADLVFSPPDTSGIIVDTTAPVFTSATTANATFAAAFAGYTAVATDASTLTYSASGLPAGLSIHSATGAITGTPTAAGSYTATLIATDAAGHSDTLELAFTVGKASAVVELGSLSAEYDGAAKNVSVSTIPHDLNIVLTYDGAATVPSAAGSYAVTATVVDDNYVGTTSRTLTITKAAQTISFVQPNDGVYTATPFALVATATSNLPISFVVTSGPASVTGNSLTLTGAGTVNVRATQAGDANHEAAPSVERSFTITKASATVTLGSLSATYTGSAHAATATTTPAGLTVVVTYDGHGAAPENAGTYAVAATVNDLRYSGSATGTMTIAKAAQNLSIAPVARPAVGDSITLEAISNSELPVAFSLVSGPGTVSGNSVHITGSEADVIVRATQEGDGNHEAASAELVINAARKLAQTITFQSIPAQRADAEPLPLIATATSGLPVSFTISSGPGMLNNGVLTLTGVPGDVVVTASQAGNTKYEAALDVVRTFSVSAVGPQVFFGSMGSEPLAASLTQDGTSGTIIGILPGSGEAFVATFSVQPDGTWEASTPAFYSAPMGPAAESSVRAFGLGTAPTRSTSRTSLASAVRAFRGTVKNGVLSGTVDGLDLSFSAELQPPTGNTATMAGYYEAPSINSASGATYSVVGTRGRVYVLAITASTIAGTEGTLNNDGSFAVDTPQQVTIIGSVDASSSSVAGTILLPGGKIEDFSGVRDSTLRTDRLINLSTRAYLNGASGAGPLITGFAVGGTAPKQVLVRAVGPALSAFGIDDAATDTQLRVFDGEGRLIAKSDDWNSSVELTEAMYRAGAFALAPGSKDAATLLTLAPGTYTMHVEGASGPGVALAEIYDASANPSGEYQRLVNISSRGQVAGGNHVLIGGFIVSGNAPKRILIRGAGPSLATHGVHGPISDPEIVVMDGEGVIVARNDNWETPAPIDTVQVSATAAEIASAATRSGAFTLPAGSRDAALIVTLQPGAYTVQLRGVGGAAGTGLIEVYEVAP